MATLGEVSEIVRGVSFPGSAKSKEGGNGLVACLRTASVQAEIDWQDLIYVPESVVTRQNQWVRPLDIIISMANSYELVGKVALVHEVPERSTFGAFLAAIRPVLISPHFMLCVLRCSGMQAALRSGSSQTTNIANISLGRIRPLSFPVPPLAEQQRIVDKVSQLMVLVNQIEAKLAERDVASAQLLEAFAGELTEEA